MFSPPHQQQLVRAEITAKSDSTGRWRYAWSEVLTDVTDGSDAAPAAPRTGTLTSSPAVEINDAEVAVGTIVLLQQRGYAAGSLWWEFAYEPASSGSGVTVAEVDGSPSYTGTTTLRFDSADGFVLSQPSAGIARIDLAAATASQAGVVSTGAQTFGGAKTFQDATTVDDNLTVTANLIGPSGTAGTFGGSNISYGYAVTLMNDHYNSRWTYDLVSIIPVAGITTVMMSATPNGITISDRTSGDLYGSVRNIDAVSGGSAYRGLKVTLPGDGTLDGAFMLVDGRYCVAQTGFITTYRYGVTGDLAPGAKVAGGIVYDLGSGSFLSDPGNGLAAGSYP